MKLLFEPLHTEHVSNEAMINFEVEHTSITNNETYCVEILKNEEVNRS